MASVYSKVHEALVNHSSATKAAFFPRFFKTGKGEYGEGDKFLGVVVPAQRAVAKQYWKEAEEEDIIQLLDSAWHEERLTGLFILTAKFREAYKKDPAKNKWWKLYLKKMDRVNNWDLVDSSAPQILGCWLEDKDRSILYKLAAANDLWKNRIAIISTQHFIRNNDLDDLEKIAQLLLPHKHDLIHKAVGWMLREAWQKNPVRIEEWLNRNKAIMPRTMLRYAIEKMEKEKKERYMSR